jgi:hypothetical protein
MLVSFITNIIIIGRIMKNTFLKIAVATVPLLLAVGYTGTASAHSQTGSLGVGVGATDLYQVSCYDDGSGTGATAYLASSVTTGAAPLGRISVRTQKAAKATNTTDATNGDTVGSPFVANNGGNGVYYMTVGKTSATAAPVSYTIQFHCVNSAGGHTGTSSVMLQNQ